MYLLNAETEIQWVLSPTEVILVLANIDMVIVSPSGLTTYIDSAILAENYVAPTATVPGSATHLITPDKEGLWRVLLVTGTALNYTVISKVEMFVLDNTLIVNPIKNTATGVNGAIEVADDLGLVTSAATKLTFKGFDVTELNGNANIQLPEYPVVQYQTPSDILAALAGSVTTSHLVSTLKTRIDKIDDNTVGSVNARVQTVDDRVTGLAVTLNDPNTGVAANASAINVLSTWVAEVNGSMVAEAGSTTQFITNVGNNAAAIEENITSIDGINLQYTVKTDINGYISGFGFASTLNDATPYSEFAIAADRFSIGPPVGVFDSGATAPFFHLAVPTVVNGVTVPAGTYMQSAFIHDASITNAKISNVIESADGGLSWRISKDGGIEGTSITIRNTVGDPLLTSDGTGIVMDTLAALQTQADGAIATWYYSGIPTNLVLPESTWTTEALRIDHLDDFYTDKDTGKTYRYTFISPDYVWLEFEHPSVTAALLAAIDAADTADGKRAIYYGDTPPTLNGSGVPLSSADNGDLWLDSYNNNKQYRYAYSTGTDTDWTNNPVTYDVADWSKIVNDNGSRPADNATDNSAWSHTSDVTKIDGGKIYANTITADRFITTLQGDLNQALYFTKTLLSAGDEYVDALDSADFVAATKVNVDADFHADYGNSIRINTTALWDEVGVTWDSGEGWDTPTESSCVYTSASQDIGALKTLQLSLEAAKHLDSLSSATILVEMLYSLDNIVWGNNEGLLNNNTWDIGAERNVTGDTYRWNGNLHAFRYFKVRITLTTSNTAHRIILANPIFLGNVVNIYGYFKGQTIAAGGTAFTINGYNAPPAITVTSKTDVRIPVITGDTAAGFTAHLYNIAGSDVGGTADIIIMGS